MSLAYGEWLQRSGRCGHPMLNPVILETVFKHLEKVKDILACRLVCKTWNALALPLCRNGVKITIHGNESTKNHTIENFVDLCRSSPLGIPYTRFKLGSFCTTEGVGQEFLLLCGDEILEIDFLEGYFNVEDISELLKSSPKLEIFKIPPHLNSRSGNPIKLFPADSNSEPKLKSLSKFIVFLDHPVERIKCCPTFMEELITAAENIHSFDLWDYSTPGNLNNIPGCSSEVFSVIDKLSRESRVGEFRIAPDRALDVDVDLLRRMTEKPEGLKLKKLKYLGPYSISSSDSEDHTLLQLLSVFKNTLQYLKIHGNRTSSFEGFPKMLSLTKLHIWVGSYKKFNFRLTNCNLNKMFPALEELVIFQSVSDYDLDEFFPISDPCPNVKKFQLQVDINFTLKGFTEMVNVFPNLTDLTIQIKGNGVEIIRLIWSQMRKLKYLHISCPAEMMDSLMDMRRYMNLDSLDRLKHIIVIHCELRSARFEIFTKDVGLVNWTIAYNGR